MAAQNVQTLEITRDEYHGIFGSLNNEMDAGESGIDVSNMGDESNESESSESEIDSEGEQPIEWTNRLRNIDVEVFTSPV